LEHPHLFHECLCLDWGLEKTGVLTAAASGLALILGRNITLGALLLMGIVGLLSSLIPNIPLVVAMVPMLKEYVVSVGLASGEILNADFAGTLPPMVLPLFYAMMYGATLGGNGTLVGASSNIVAAGIAEQHGQRISFQCFLRYGALTC
jgi:Na+/H+ antiporter NhaD/arsenite permease-like protein